MNLKLMIATLLIALLTITSILGNTQSSDSVLACPNIKGDVNFDNTVDVTDIVDIKQVIEQQVTPIKCREETTLRYVTDINNDQNTNILDLQIVLNKFLESNDQNVLSLVSVLNSLNPNDTLTQELISQMISNILGTNTQIIPTSFCPTVYGDVNNDNQVNIFDIQIMINTVLGKSPQIKCNEQGRILTDLNNDRATNVFDIQILIPLVLQDSPQTQAKPTQRVSHNFEFATIIPTGSNQGYLELINTGNKEEKNIQIYASIPGLSIEQPIVQNLNLGPQDKKIILFTLEADIQGQYIVYFTAQNKKHTTTQNVVFENN